MSKRRNINPNINTKVNYSELNSASYEGTFIGNERGFGFVEVPERQEDIFIPPEDTFTAMNGDKVIVRTRKNHEKGKREEGVIIEILERANEEIVGTFEKSKDFGFVIADDKHIFQDIFIPKRAQNKAKNNDKVVVKITSYTSKGKSFEGKIVDVLGKAGDSRVDLISTIKTFNLREEFPKEVIKEAKEIPQVVRNIDNRVDLRDKEIFTIDGDDTKDIDDAVSLEWTNNKYILGVHIADVSNYVLEGSELDKEAIKRGTSVYLVDTVLPMLPKELSNGICSLNENEDRYALSISIVLDKDANILDYKVFKSVIRSNKQMTYSNVYKTVSDDLETPDEYKAFETTLKKMKELAIKLQERRHNCGAIDFDLPEPKVYLNDESKAIDVKVYEVTIANQMIEQFMVLANECIAKKYNELKTPFIYRIHEKPNADKISKLKILLKNLNISEDFTEELKPIEIQNVIEQVKGKEEEKVVSMMALRSMQLAKYSDENLGHYGLALENYCHFTSPIRRYPDLFIHRMISKQLNGEFDTKSISKYRKQAVKYSEILSDCERNAEEAEDDYVQVKMCEFMQFHINEEFDGIISSVTSFGVFVELPNLIEGLAHVENMRDDYYEYDEEKCVLVGQKTKKVLRIGNKVRVKILSSSKISRRIEMTIC